MRPDRGSAPRQAESPGQLGRAEPARKLRQGQNGLTRVSASELVGDPLVQSPRNHRGQERSRIGSAKTDQSRFREARELLARLTGDEAHDNRVRDSLRATNANVWAEALSSHCAFVDRASERALLGRLGQQARAPPGRRRIDPAQGHRSARTSISSACALRQREAIKAIEQRRAQLMQCRERQLHLRLAARRTDARCRSDGGLDRVFEERRLSDSCLPRNTRAPLRPARAAWSSPSSAAHSSRRPRSLSPPGAD